MCAERCGHSLRKFAWWSRGDNPLETYWSPHLLSSQDAHVSCPERKEDGEDRQNVEHVMPTEKWMKNNVVYSMFCLECEAEYIGETERSICERFAEHYRQARALTPGTPWGVHYAMHHHACQTASARSVKPFGRASILATENCKPAHPRGNVYPQP